MHAFKIIIHPDSQSPCSQLTTLLNAAYLALLPNNGLLAALSGVDVAREDALVEGLLAGGHVEGRVLVEEVDGLETDLNDLDGHDGEVLDARDVVETELDPDHGVGVQDIILAGRERAHARAAARLVRVLTTCVQLTVGV